MAIFTAPVIRSPYLRFDSPVTPPQTPTVQPDFTLPGADEMVALGEFLTGNADLASGWGGLNTSGDSAPEGREIGERLRGALQGASDRADATRGGPIEGRTPAERVSARMRDRLREIIDQADAERGGPIDDRTPAERVSDRMRDRLREITDQADAERGGPIDDRTPVERVSDRMRDRIREVMEQAEAGDAGSADGDQPGAPLLDPVGMGGVEEGGGGDGDGGGSRKVQ